eukprot:TRINITY_DN37483_c0_g1_i1.p1 TRINITY_DN37483_c0_g1~~TRINITY_DN37483_c0_g1_i1.p1  ORF type:complete len:809 (-),score=123.72 TRINITY_DN37483_c0_g1_i1:52-2478(-)
MLGTTFSNGPLSARPGRLEPLRGHEIEQQGQRPLAEEVHWSEFAAPRPSGGVARPLRQPTRAPWRRKGCCTEQLPPVTVPSTPSLEGQQIIQQQQQRRLFSPRLELRALDPWKVPHTPRTALAPLELVVSSIIPPSVEDVNAAAVSVHDELPTHVTHSGSPRTRRPRCFDAVSTISKVETNSSSTSLDTYVSALSRANSIWNPKLFMMAREDAVAQSHGFRELSACVKASTEAALTQGRYVLHDEQACAHEVCQVAMTSGEHRPSNCTTATSFHPSRRIDLAAHISPSVQVHWCGRPNITLDIDAIMCGGRHDGESGEIPVKSADNSSDIDKKIEVDADANGASVLGGGDAGPERVKLIPPPVLISDWSPLDVAVRHRQLGGTRRAVVLVVEIGAFRDDGSVDLGHVSGMSPQCLLLRSNASQFLSTAEKAIWRSGSGQTSMRDHLTVRSDPYLAVCRDVTIFRGPREQGYPFLKDPFFVHIIFWAMPSTRPQVQITRKDDDRKEWYMMEFDHIALVERLNLVGAAAMQYFQESSADADLNPVLILPLPGSSGHIGHPRDAVATAIRQWRHRFTSHFHSIFVCCGNRGDINCGASTAQAEYIAELVNRQLHKMADTGAFVMRAAKWHWTHWELDMCADSMKLAALAGMIESKFRRMTARETRRRVGKLKAVRQDMRDAKDARRALRRRDRFGSEASAATTESVAQTESSFDQTDTSSHGCADELEEEDFAPPMTATHDMLLQAAEAEVCSKAPPSLTIRDRAASIFLAGGIGAKRGTVPPAATIGDGVFSLAAFRKSFSKHKPEDVWS